MCVNFLGFSQNSYFNDDGTISNEAKQELMVGVFNKNEISGTHFEITNKYFVVTTKSDCGDKEFESEEIQKKALYYSFVQLLNQISAFKRYGYNNFSDIGFEGIIFKTNTIRMYNTRRYHFKFNSNELNSFPEYMDI